MTPSHKPDCNPDAPASFAGPVGSVWVVTWHEQNRKNSGIHGVWAAEADARAAAVMLTKRTPYEIVYRATQWTVTPNDKVSDPAQ